MTPITPEQKKELHTIVALLKWSNLSYVKWLINNYGVDSCLLLTQNQATQAIETLRQMAASNKITEKQISYIKFLWISVDFSGCEQGNNLLNNFLHRKYGVDSVEQLTKQQAFGAIAAIKQMQQNRKAVKIDSDGAVTWVTLEDGQRFATIKNPNIQ